MAADTAEVIIIGGGITGCSIAYHLARKGVKEIKLLERSVLAAGSTGKSTGVVRTHYSREITAKMALDSLHVFENFKEVVGGHCDFAAVGVLFALTPDQAGAAEDSVTMQRSLGIDTEVVSWDGLRQIDPRLHMPEEMVFVYEPRSGYADPYATALSYGQRAREMGVEVRLQTPVTGILRSSAGVGGVVTPEGEIHGPLIVNAAGPWGARVASWAGLSLPLSVSNHDVATFRRPEKFGKVHPVVIDFHTQAYVRPEVGELTLAGSIRADHGVDLADADQYTESIRHSSIEEFAESICAIYPSLEESTSRGGWAGMYTTTPDWNPILGAIGEVPGFYVALGFSGHGFKLGPAVGRAMADLIVDGGCEAYDLEFFSPYRFQRGISTASKYVHGIMG